ncbi:hypothetical protein AURDEDRAFT_169480 [Auricularia subglabra TFB-10046 SS5]|uniref:Uncharacterized protein n=1 Tax=Auricularia subglabra (strain TFB-10046 / SS5) TaxID=717982 RepID=J0DD66_AURST|nr:hypothetical protein AURDEDRAFT_169480 [Auricularia subglabra TFB-10046 SS5]
MTACEEEAARFARELQASDNVEDVLKRIKASIAWTPALAESTAGNALSFAISFAPPSTAQKEAQAAYHDQLRAAEVKETMENWWSYPPLTVDLDDVLELTFVDLTPGNERWGPERVLCTEREPFAHAAQRFRVQANKKHRHPWLPSMHYSAILGEGDSKRATFDSLAARTVADVLGEQSAGRIVEYVRDDDSRAHRDERVKSPARLFAPWDRARILPAWCTTPDSWIDPVPPPGFGASQVQGSQFYVAVPTLHVPGIGIVPSATKPQCIVRTLYWPVRQSGDAIDAFPLDREQDYVPPSKRLIPSALTAEDAQALLGRFIQSSIEPLREDGPPSNKKRKTAPRVNKYASQSVAVAWGLTLDDEGRPDWLHCVIPLQNWLQDCAYDLKGLRRSLGIPNVARKECAWIGAVVLPADKRALESSGGKELEPQGPTPVIGETFVQWTLKTERWIKLLNATGIDKLVEVGQDETFVAGDIELAKADTDEWEASITGAKPGLWRMFVAESGTVYCAWVREGTLDYDALPQFNGGVEPEEDGEWEEVATFSIDSGTAALFSKSALDLLIGAGDKQERMEILASVGMDDLGEYVPGGVVVLRDDGGYAVEGIKDATGKLIKLRIRSG